MDLNEKRKKRREEALSLPLKRIKEQAEQLKVHFEKERFQEKTIPLMLRALGLFAAAYALSFSPTLFGCLPMGLSLLCAAEADLLFIWLGCFAGALDNGSDLALFLTVYTLIFALKLHFSYRSKEKSKAEPYRPALPKSLRVTLALLSALAFGLYGCFAESFSLHAFFALLFYLLSSGVLTFLLAGAFEKTPYRTLSYKIGQATLAVLVVFSANSFSFFGFSASLTLATLFVFLLAKKEHPLFCALAGLFLGLACQRSLAPVPAITGAVCALLSKLNRRTAPWIALLSGFAFAFYATGSNALLYTLPDMICGLLLYIPINAYLEKRTVEKAHRSIAKEGEGTDDPFVPALTTLSEKLSSLSGVLHLPDAHRACHLCQKGVEEICGDCGAGCFSSEKGLARLSDTLFETGRLLFDKPPEGLSSGCTRYEKLCNKVNEDYARYMEELSQKDPAGCYAQCYQSVARLIADREKRATEESGENEEYGKRFQRALDLMRISCTKASVMGKRELYFKAEGVNLSDLSRGAMDLKSYFERECGIPLSLPRLVFTERERALCFARRTAFCLAHGSARQKKEGEEYCGDTLLTFTRSSYGYFLLCDGMGSGMDAALSSGIACCFIEQLSLGGASLETALKTVNDFLLGQKNECSTTVDLLRIDLYDGSCDFIKSGTCPSIVLRGGNVFKIASASMPQGATREMSCERISLNLRAGDRIIMASDGVASDIEGSVWLKDLLAGRLKNDPQGLAEDILALCKQDSHPDDRSVLVIDLLDADESLKQQPFKKKADPPA